MWSTAFIQSLTLLVALPQVINALSLPASDIVDTQSALVERGHDKAHHAPPDTQPILEPRPLPGARPVQPKNPAQPQPGPRRRPVDGRREDREDKSELVGEPHGKAFDDVGMTTQHKRIKEVTLSGCDNGFHLSYIGLKYRSAEGATSEVSHGTAYINAKPRTLKLEYSEKIVRVSLTTWRKKVAHSHHTRIGWMKLETNFGHGIECGAKLDTDDQKLWYAKNFEETLLYFSGSSGDEIDALQGHFIPNTDV